MHCDATDITSRLFNPQEILRLILQYTFTAYSCFIEWYTQQYTHLRITDTFIVLFLLHISVFPAIFRDKILTQQLLYFTECNSLERGLG